MLLPTQEQVEKLLYLHKVAAEYFDNDGNRVSIDHSVRCAVLHAKGLKLDDAERVQQFIDELDVQPWRQWVAATQTLWLNEERALELRFASDELDSKCQWRLHQHGLTVVDGALIPSELPEIGDYLADGVRYSARGLAIDGVASGYYTFELRCRGEQARCEVIIAPQHCARSGLDEQEKQPWGISCQLYSLRSESSWGIGDFADLLELLHLSAAQGADLVALNPLHAPISHHIEHISPYSPSDRRFLNPIYIALPLVPEFTASTAVQSKYRSAAFQTQLKAVNTEPLIDYEAVAQLKLSVLSLMFEYFYDNEIEAKSPRAVEFEGFVKLGGRGLGEYAEFSASDRRHSDVIANTPKFQLYLQWLAASQLRACQTRALDLGMSIGLMGDLAVGAVPEGAEVRQSAHLYAAGATIGAPPDDFAPHGQNWQLAVADPVAMINDRYQHFTELIRNNMSYYGALRVDHVMSLLRLWWCLPETQSGAYVYYPFDELSAIVCLESVEQQCLVIGEDMGLVPDIVRDRMAAMSALSSRLLYFERNHSGDFPQAGEGTQQSLLMVSNHDVPPLAAWWEGVDLAERALLGHLNDEQSLAAQEQRLDAKQAMLRWLDDLNVSRGKWHSKQQNDRANQPFDMDLCHSICLACASLNTNLLLIQLDDLRQSRQLINIPGTHLERPNWRCRQAETSSELFAKESVSALLADVDHARNCQHES